MKQIIIINGRGGVGKDTFIEMVKVAALVAHDSMRKNCPKIYNLSTITGIKRIATQIGWNGEKDEESRKLLSNLKDLLTQYNDFPVTELKREINGIQDNSVIFIHTREPAEIARLKEELGALTLLIKNSRVPLITSNHADRNAENYDYDLVIENEGTFGDLSEKASVFLDALSV